MIVVTKKSSKEKVAEMFAAGHTDQEIAERTGLNKQTIYDHRSNMGLIRTKAHVAPRPREMVPVFIPESKPLMEMAKDVLVGRLKEKPDGWHLDGRVEKLEKIIPEANRNLKAWGLSQIGPAHWRIT